MLGSSERVPARAGWLSSTVLSVRSRKSWKLSALVASAPKAQKWAEKVLAFRLGEDMVLKKL